MLKRAVLLIAGLSALAGCDEQALATLGGATSTADQRADYLSAVATTDCVLIDQRQFGAVEFQANLTRQEVIEITQFYLAIGNAERLPEGGVRVTTGPCAA
ncbi:MAG: hypothetical protein CML66_12735 [Rhodobacteraceae bacterium]|nr:hypothetical protein [Paracoccaceae bacterium]MAY48070.1 hypothetical protein [Paracoccaceae bacterium]QEW21344.1 hypothetical protein LA6_003552 [Marinibacterium anthonyi]